MDTLKVVTDPGTSGRYIGVYHWLTGGAFSVGVATSTDLRTWTYRRTVDTPASQPSVAFGPGPAHEPVLAVEASSGAHLRFKYWTSIAGFLGTAAPAATFDAGRTLSSCAEGTPDIRTVTFSGSGNSMTAGSSIVVGHHYFSRCDTDREAIGTLTNFGMWTTAAQPALDQALTTAGAAGKHGDRDTFAVGGRTMQLFEGSVSATSFQMADWRNYLYDGTTAQQLSVRTPGGSHAFANASATVIQDPEGVLSLLVTQFIPGGGAAAGESGELLYWNPLPTATTAAVPPPTTISRPPTTVSQPPTTPGTSTPTTQPTPTTRPTTTTAMPTPTTSPSQTPTKASKVLVFVEENHSLAQMQSGMPFLFSLAKRYAYADNFTAITHPSEPNYIAIAAGSTLGDTADHNPAKQLAGQSVFGQALAGGRSAKSYAESMGSSCQQSDSGSYKVKHNPWASFTDERAACNAGNVPMGVPSSGAMHNDVVSGNLPNVGMAIPNICNDAHDCPLTTADAWLRSWLVPIMAGPDYQSGRLAVVITADEDDRNSGNKVLTVVIHRSQSQKVVTSPLNHYSLSGFYSDMAGGPRLRNAATAPSFVAAFGL